MSVRPVLRMGHPLLNQVAAEIAPDDPALAGLVADLRDTMVASGGVGLAAPQIGVSLRVVVLGTGEVNPRYPEQAPIPFTVLVNPVITPLGEAMESAWEGCLSLPGLRGQVARWRRIRYRAWNQRGEPVSGEAEGFHARVIQHECDHLDGVLYPQRMDDLRQFGFVEELERAGRIAAVPG